MTLAALTLAMLSLPAGAAPEEVREQVASMARALRGHRYDRVSSLIDQLGETTSPSVRGSFVPYARVMVAAKAGECEIAERALAELKGSAWLPSAREAVGSCWWRQNKRRRALSLVAVKGTPTTDKERCVSLWHQARLQRRSGEERKAARALREIYTRCPTSYVGSQAWHALQTLSPRQSARLAPKTSAELRFEAERWMRNGRYRRARRTLNKALRRAQGSRDRPAEAAVRLDLSRLYIAHGWYHRALQQTSKLLNRRRFTQAQVAEAYRLQADVLSRSGRTSAAFTALRACLKLSRPTAARARCRLDLVELSVRKASTEEARALLTVFFSGGSGRRVHRRALHRARWLDAWLAWRGGGLPEGAQPIARLIESAPTNSQALYWIGRWQSLVGEPAAAVEYWRDAESRDLLGYYGHAARSVMTSRHGEVAPLLTTSPALNKALSEDRWFVTDHPDMTAAQDLTQLGLHGEALRWLKPVGNLERLPDERMALAQIYLRHDRPFWSNSMARHAVRPFLLHHETTRLAERADDEACAELRGPCPSDPVPTPLREQAELAMRLAFPLPFRSPVEEAANRKDLPAALIYAVIYEESAFNPRAHSSRRARGLMQLIGPTARRMARLEKMRRFRVRKLLRPEVNIRLGSRYLAELWRRYDGVPALVFAAYHAGERRVDQWIRDRGALPLDAFIEEIPFSSTRGYVQRSVATTASYARLYFPDPRLAVPFDTPLTDELREKIATIDHRAPLPGSRRWRPPPPTGVSPTTPQAAAPDMTTAEVSETEEESTALETEGLIPSEPSTASPEEVLENLGPTDSIEDEPLGDEALGDEALGDETSRDETSRDETSGDEALGEGAR